MARGGGGARTPGLDSVVLLCHVPPFVAAVAAALRAHHPGLRIHPVADRAGLERLDLGLLLNARLIGFTTGTVVPGWMLRAAGFGAYNFHPGPPDYPGWGPLNFALYEGARHFGVTAHAMEAAVDSGAIVGASRFPVPAGIDYDGLQGLMVAALMRLLGLLARPLATEPGPLAPIPLAWGPLHYTRRTAEGLRAAGADAGPEERARLARAFPRG